MAEEAAIPPTYLPWAKNHVWDIGDIDIPHSFFLTTWTNQYTPAHDVTALMERSIREELSGTGMGQYRKDLIEHLDHVPGQVDQRLERSASDVLSLDAKERYTRLRAASLDVDE